MGTYNRESGGYQRDSVREFQFARDSGRERDSGPPQDSAREQGYARDSGRESAGDYGRNSGYQRDSSTYQRDSGNNRGSGYGRDSGPRQSSGYATAAGGYGRDSVPHSSGSAALANYPAEAAAAYMRESGGHGRGGGFATDRLPNGLESRPSFESPRPGDPGAALDSARDTHISAECASRRYY